MTVNYVKLGETRFKLSQTGYLGLYWPDHFSWYEFQHQVPTGNFFLEMTIIFLEMTKLGESRLNWLKIWWFCSFLLALLPRPKALAEILFLENLIFLALGIQLGEKQHAFWFRILVQLKLKKNMVVGCCY